MSEGHSHLQTWTVNKVKRSQAYRYVVCCPSGRRGQREWPLRKNSHEMRWKSWVVRKENRRRDRRRREGLRWKPISEPSCWREDVCLHVSYQVVCNLPVGYLSNKWNWMWWSSSLLASHCVFGPTCFILLFSCVFPERTGICFYLSRSLWVALSRWAVQSCSAASVNNCFDLHPWSWLPVSPCWVSGASCFLSLLAMM